MEDRHHRPGQPNAVTYVDFITEDTVDRRVQKVLESKKTLAEWLMEDRGRLSDIFDPSCVYRG
jgi:SNF2 family DNA or RNA helicase